MSHKNHSKEGFGLACTEAMWNGKVVIAGNVGGLKIQIASGRNGYLVNSPVDCANKIIKLIQNPKLAHRLGVAAKKTISEKFLIPKLLLDHLKIYLR